MNIYKILHKNKTYVTMAENIMEAEDKFINEFKIDLTSCPNILVEQVEETEDISKKEITQF